MIRKKAAKGGPVIIMNTKHNLQMISDHLNDEKTYKMFEANFDVKVIKGIAKIVEKYIDKLTKKEKRYLTSFSYDRNNFYVLPKIHKSKLIQNATKEQQKEYAHIIEPSILKLRPFSNLLYILSKSFLLHIKSYTKNDLDFLSKRSRENYEDALLLTFDVVDLNTNISHNFRLEFLDYWV